MRARKRGRDVRVTPSMRRKVDDLATWIAAGDASQVDRARRAIVELLCAAGGSTPERLLRRARK
jgi:hypothetical protein